VLCGGWHPRGVARWAEPTPGPSLSAVCVHVPRLACREGSWGGRERGRRALCPDTPLPSSRSVRTNAGAGEGGVGVGVMRRVASAGCRTLAEPTPGPSLSAVCVHVPTLARREGSWGGRERGRRLPFGGSCGVFTGRHIRCRVSNPRRPFAAAKRRRTNLGRRRSNRWQKATFKRKRYSTFVADEVHSCAAAVPSRLIARMLLTTGCMREPLWALKGSIHHAHHGDRAGKESVTLLTFERGGRHLSLPPTVPARRQFSRTFCTAYKNYSARAPQDASPGR
jgi:hypothetical protein